MEPSILKSTKKLLQVALDDTSFDLDIMTHVNSAFSTLHDLGVGPKAGFAIDDDEAQWTEFLPSLVDDLVQLNQVKSFVAISVRLAFDPPQTAHLLGAAEKQLEELTWRLNARRENEEWVDPNAIEQPEVAPEPTVLDGGVMT